MSTSNTVLELQNVSVAYGKATALHAINLRVSQGEVVALIGANGAGKSTTLRAISGLLKLTNGDILLDNASIAGHRPDTIVRGALRIVPRSVAFGPI